MFGIFKKQDKEVDEGSPLRADPSLAKEINSVLERNPIPTLWLFGKTGSGKSSVIRQLTGSSDAKIGQGFRPETRFSRRFDFPDGEETLLRFLDTRGLGEAHYDPTEDIDSFHATSHLVLVTVRLVDHALDSVLEPLRKVRAAASDRPILLVLTCMHEATPGNDLSASPEVCLNQNVEHARIETLGETIQGLIELKKRQFEGLFDKLALIDFTHEEDGFANNGYGEETLKQLILELLPLAYRQTWNTAMSEQPNGKSELQRKSHWQILASSTLAATAGAVPLPWVNMPVVLAIQTRMMIKIASIYEQKVTRKHWFALSNVAGTQVAIRMASRELLKFIPFVGIAASIASSFAFTFALGKVADLYFFSQSQGFTPTDEELRILFADQLSRGQQLWGNAPK